MPKEVPVGARAETEQIVRFEHTLSAHHESLPPVLSTPNMILFMELACFHALQPFAEGDEITVGTGINIVHLAPTPVDINVKASAEMESYDGRSYVMRVRAWTETKGGTVTEIGRGTIGRAYVSVGRFTDKMKRRHANS